MYPIGDVYDFKFITYCICWVFMRYYIKLFRLLHINSGDMIFRKHNTPLKIENADTGLLETAHWQLWNVQHNKRSKNTGPY